MQVAEKTFSRKDAKSAKPHHFAKLLGFVPSFFIFGRQDEQSSWLYSHFDYKTGAQVLPSEAIDVTL